MEIELATAIHVGRLKLLNTAVASLRCNPGRNKGYGFLCRQLLLLQIMFWPPFMGLKWKESVIGHIKLPVGDPDVEVVGFNTDHSREGEQPFSIDK